MNRSGTIERKLFYAAIGWLTGIAVCSFVPVIIVIPAAAGAFALAAALRFCTDTHKKTAAVIMLMAGACLAAGVRVGCYERYIVSPLTDCAGGSITMEGIVTDIRRYDSSYYITVRGKVQQKGIRTSVTFKDNADAGLDCGDRVLIHGDVTLPRNTLTFHKEDYDRSMGVFLEGEGLPHTELLKKRSDPFIFGIKRVRARAVDRITGLLPSQEGAFLAAILCSYKDNLDAATSSAIYRAGLGHLFAVSGTHVVMLCAFIGLLLDAVRFPVKTRSVLMTLFLVSFAVFSGCSPSVVRACIMMEMTQLGGFFNRQNDSANSLGLAAIIMTARCPYTLCSLSFMLSFTAALAVGTVAPAICRKRISGSTARSAMAVITVNTLTAPICVVSFSEVSLISAAANLLLIPLCSLCLCLCFLYLLTGCTLTPLLAAAGVGARGIIRLCRLITASRLSFAGTYYSRSMLLIAVAAALVFPVCAFVRRHRRRVIIACAAAYVMLVCGLFLCDRLPKGDSITVYPAQYGCTCVVESGQEVLIFDSGGMGANAYAAARRTERRHPERVYLYTLDNKEKSYDRLTAELADTNDYCYALLPEGINSTGGSPLARFEDTRLIVTVNGREITFGKDSFTLGGDEYSYDGFYDISYFSIK